MTRKRTPVEVLVPDSLREAVLNIAVQQPDGSITSVGFLLQSASEAVTKANEALAANGLVEIATKDLMRGYRRRGRADIIVNANGDVVLRIGGDPAKGISFTTAQGGAGLPSMKRLRDIAEQRGMDISDLGRRKREIIRRLDGVCQTDTPREPVDTPREPVGPPTRMRDEVRTSDTPLPRIKLPPR